MFCERDSRSPSYIAFAFFVVWRPSKDVGLEADFQAAAAENVFMVCHALWLVQGCWCKVLPILNAAGLTPGCTVWC